jgi:predicted dehydrogenase
MGGGWLGAIGVHWLDFTRWTFGEITDVAAKLRTTVSEKADSMGVLHRCTAEDGFVLTLQTDQGVTVTMDASGASPTNLVPSLVVVGSHGVIEEVGMGQRVLLHTSAGTEEVFTAGAGSQPTPVTLRAWASAIRDVVRDGLAVTDLPTFEDGLACAHLLERIKRIGSSPSA